MDTDCQIGEMAIGYYWLCCRELVIRMLETQGKVSKCHKVSC